MGKYIIRRILLMIPVILGVTVLIFTFLYFSPGDPAQMLLGDQATPEEVDALREEMGLNDHYFVQLGRYIWKACHGNFGESYINGRPVSDELLKKFPTTVILATLGTVVSVLFAVPLGVLSATHQNRLLDNIARLVSLAFVSMPIFWEGLMMILIFAVNLKWLPASGFYGPVYWILPVITVGLQASGTILRSTRSSMLETIRQDYIRTARAKGAAEGSVIWRHALGNAMISILTVIGLRFSTSLGGSVVSETIFSIPGLGRYIVDGIRQRDYPIVQGGVLLICIACSVINLIIDILYAYVDPRIKSQYARKKQSKNVRNNAEKR